MKIAVMEKTNFSEAQLKRLNGLGQVDFYDNLSQDDVNKLAPDYDAVVVNWLDPTPFIMNMKKGSLVALLSTGYGWISNIKEAHDKGIFVANIPNYSTEAVSEHLLGLLLGITKNIFSTINRENNHIVGSELKDKTVGIIGLGNIGKRFADMMTFFGTKVIAYNRSSKNYGEVKDVSLDELLANSDIICITCSVNSDSKGMINSSNVNNIKNNAFVIGSTWDIITDDAMVTALDKGLVRAIAFDAAVEASDCVRKDLTKYSDRVFLTPHIAYNTYEAEKNQIDILIDNIENFVNGTPNNIVW